MKAILILVLIITLCSSVYADPCCSCIKNKDNINNIESYIEVREPLWLSDEANIMNSYSGGGWSKGSVLQHFYGNVSEYNRSVAYWVWLQQGVIAEEIELVHQRIDRIEAMVRGVHELQVRSERWNQIIKQDGMICGPGVGCFTWK